MSLVEARPEERLLLDGVEVEAVGGSAKRAFDVVVASLLLIFFLPFMVVVVLAIYSSGPGPAMFGHSRIGQGGRPFRCLKFRSMVPDADRVLAHLLENDEGARREWETTQKLRNDPRITKIGRILRRSSLDELPQLVNVIRGEMSLIGPRPIVRSEASHYGDRIKYYLSARPGITGLWQVSGRTNCDYSTRVKHDSNYCSNWSWRLDMTILAKTAVVVFKFDEAA